MDFKIGIIEPGDFSEEAVALLKTAGEVDFHDADKAEVSSFIADKHCIFVRLNYFYGAQTLQKAKRLRYICSPTTGLNHIDLAYAQKAGIRVVSLRGETEFLKTITATPEHTFGLALALLRNYNRAFLSASNTQWNRDLYKGFELSGIRAGIIGLGRVGNLLCKYLHAFGARVFYFDTDRAAQNEYRAERTDSIGQLIDACELVFLCASYSPQNDAMLSRAYIDGLANKFFVNTARGELVDEEYMIECIERGHFRGVAVDVVANETGDNNAARLARLTQGRNLIVTPHIAGATYSSMWKTEVFIAKKLMGYLP